VLLHWSEFIKLPDSDRPTSAPSVDNHRISDRTGAGNGVGTGTSVSVGVDAVPTRNAIHFEGPPLEETLSTLKENEKNLEGGTASTPHRCIILFCLALIT
jgi:hypothetical protein